MEVESVRGPQGDAARRGMQRQPAVCRVEFASQSRRMQSRQPCILTVSGVVTLMGRGKCITDGDRVEIFMVPSCARIPFVPS